MKKTLIAIASVAALGAAQADVTLYGVIDASLATVSAGGSTDPNNPGNLNFLNSYGAAGSGSLQQGGSALGNGRVTGVGNGFLTPSRWGLKGTEDLGSGMKANFVLESALNISGGSNPNDHLLLANGAQTVTGSGDSSLNGQMFDRQASVGLSGDFGSIDAGFQLNLNGELNGANDPFGAGYISPLGFYGGLTGAGSSYTGRASNSFKYAYAMGNTTLKAFYALGGVSGNTGAGSQVGLAAFIKATPTLDINFGASRMNDDVSYNTGSGASVASSATATVLTGSSVAAGAAQAAMVPGLAASYYNSTESTLAANWQATPTLKLRVGYIGVSQTNPSNPVADAAIVENNGIPINPNKINTSPYASTYNRSIYWLGANYDVSPVSHLNVGYYNLTLGAYTGNVVATGSLTQAYSSNTMQEIAASFTYDLSKKTDVYIAGAYQSWNAPGDLNKNAITATASASNATPVNQTASAGTNQTVFAVGLRTKF
jgi:predicted porin